MNYPEYLQDIKAIYRSEVTGEVMFAILASVSFSAQKKHKAHEQAIDRFAAMAFLQRSADSTQVAAQAPNYLWPCV